MDELLKIIEVDNIDGMVRGFTVAEFLISTFLSIVLSMIMATVYRYSHTGLSYSRSFVLTMIIMSVTISFIMMIIGSNLARAFSLVGALSIVRYRNAVKDSRDTAYIFLVMAIGMACGTKIYIMAIVFTVITASLLLLLDRFTFATTGRSERLLQFNFDGNSEYGHLLQEELKNVFKGHFDLLSSELVGDRKVLVYSVEIGYGENMDNLLDLFRGKFSDLDIKLLTGFEKFNI